MTVTTTRYCSFYRYNIAKYCHRNWHDHLECDHDLNGNHGVVNHYGITTTLSVTKINKTLTANVITADAMRQYTPMMNLCRE